MMQPPIVMFLYTKLHDTFKKNRRFVNKIILNEFTQITNWQTVFRANSFVRVFFLYDPIIRLCFQVDLHALFFF